MPAKTPQLDPLQTITTKKLTDSPRPQPRTRVSPATGRIGGAPNKTGLPHLPEPTNTSLNPSSEALVFLICSSDGKQLAAAQGTAPPVSGQGELTLDAQEIIGHTVPVEEAALGEAVGDTLLTNLHPMRRTFNISADHGRVDVISPARSEDDFDLRSNPSSGSCSRQEPLRHTNTSQKGKNWSCDIIKLIVILGDSNLSRIPSFIDDRVQIDSFPRAGD